jgi:hypothetical protein
MSCSEFPFLPLLADPALFCLVLSLRCHQEDCFCFFDTELGEGGVRNICGPCAPL